MPKYQKFKRTSRRLKSYLFRKNNIIVYMKKIGKKYAAIIYYPDGTELVTMYDDVQVLQKEVYNFISADTRFTANRRYGEGNASVSLLLPEVELLLGFLPNTKENYYLLNKLRKCRNNIIHNQRRKNARISRDNKRAAKMVAQQIES